jgi:hypothetical protein
MNKAEAKRVACMLVVSCTDTGLEDTVANWYRYNPTKVADRDRVQDALDELIRELGQRATYRPR